MADLPIIKAEGTTAPADLTGAAGSGAAAAASEFGRLATSADSLTEMLTVHQHTVDAAEVAKLRTAVDGDVADLHAANITNPNGFDVSYAAYRKALVEKIPGRYAPDVAEYADKASGQAAGSIVMETARQDHTLAIGALTARLGTTGARIGDLLADGRGVDALNSDPQLKDLRTEYAHTFDALVKAGAMSREEADAKLAEAASGWKASAVTGHVLQVYRTAGADAALKELSAIGHSPETPDLPPADGLKKPGNLDPWNRPIVHNPDGGYSTTQSISMNFGDGEVLIPTVWDGKHHTDHEAAERYRQTGENFGTFDTPEHADTYATALHNAQDAHVKAHGGPDGFTPDVLAPHERQLAFEKARTALGEAINVDQERTNTARTAQAQREQDTNRAIEDDVASLALTGKSNGLTEDKVMAGGGMSAVRDWYKKKADALADYRLYGDLSRLSPEQAAERMANVHALHTEKLPTEVKTPAALDALYAAVKLGEGGGEGVISRDPDGAGPAGGGAYGPGQIVPATAQRVLAAHPELGLPYDEHRLLHDGAYNDKISKAYLSDLLTRYQGDPFLAVTAYHAGEANVDKWVREFGDPRVVGRDAWLQKVRDAGNPRSAAYPGIIGAAMDGGRAWQAWDAAQKLRADDPAQAVAGDPMVQAATQEWVAAQSGKTAGQGSGQAGGFRVVQAYLDAQDRAGIKPAKRQPLPNAALDPYVNSYVDVVKSGDAAAVLQWRDRIMQQYGDPIHPQREGYGRRVLQAVLERAGESTASAAALANATVKAAPAPLASAGRTQALHAAATGTKPPPVIPAKAVDDLRASNTPQNRAFFDATFGAGAAERALKGG